MITPADYWNPKKVSSTGVIWTAAAGVGYIGWHFMEVQYSRWPMGLSVFTAERDGRATVSSLRNWEVV